MPNLEQFTKHVSTLLLAVMQAKKQPPIYSIWVKSCMRFSAY